MKKYLRKIELFLAQMLLLSASVLWYPIGSESGAKAHHVIILLLTLVSILSGDIFRFVFANIKRRPIFFLSFLCWLLTLVTTTVIFDTAWTPVKVISFFLQILIGNLAVFHVVQERGLIGLQRTLNFSLVIFFIVFIFLTGVPLNNMLELVFRAIITANPNLIIFEFLGKAPLFQSFSEDGLDGLRHTISMYIVLCLLMNLIQLRNRYYLALSVVLALVLIVLQSRSAWVALFIPLLVLGLYKLATVRLKLANWLLIIGPTPLLAAAAALSLSPIIMTRLQNTESYTGRADRFLEAWEFFGKMSLAPITMVRDFSSPHMFIFDSYYSGGLIGMFFACVFLLTIITASLPRAKVRLDPAYLGFLFATPLLVRLFTAGSGLPGLGATLAFSVAITLNQLRREKGDR